VAKSEQYRRFAQDCLLLARAAEDQRARASLLHMAHVWFRLAEEHENEAEENNRLRASVCYSPPRLPFSKP
jgi:hypothetical protein